MILCTEAALLPYTIPQTDNRSFGSEEAAATSAVDNLLLVHLMHGSTLVRIYIYMVKARPVIHISWFFKMKTKQAVEKSGFGVLRTR